MNIEEIHAEWKKDCVLDAAHLDEASRKTPELVAKYLEMHSRARSKLHVLSMSQKKLLKKKWLYYNGKMSKEEMDAEGWPYDPFEKLAKPLKSDLEYYYNSDEDIQASELRILYQKELVDVLREILDNLKWRHQSIKNAIDWQRFQAGY